PMHASLVHTLPSSAGASELSIALTVLPAPSHTFTWQSPGDCPLTGVPAAVYATPQAPAVQVRTEHSVSTPGQSLAARHDTQLPAPSHRLPPDWLHAECGAEGGFEGTQFVHTSFVHWLPSTGTSLSSGTLATLPLPSHWLRWQSPAVWLETAVPAAAG